MVQMGIRHFGSASIVKPLSNLGELRCVASHHRCLQEFDGGLRQISRADHGGVTEMVDLGVKVWVQEDFCTQLLRSPQFVWTNCTVLYVGFAERGGHLVSKAKSNPLACAVAEIRCGNSFRTIGETTQPVDL